MVEELDSLAPEDGGSLLETALVWPAGKVRAAAIERLIERGQVDRAAEAAAVDPDETVRRSVGRRADPPAQQSLF